MDKAELIREFGRALTNGSATLFCGAGLSRASGFPLWDEILELPRKELKISRSFVDLPLLAQYYIVNIPGGRERLNEHIRMALSRSALPNKNHYLLSQLPVREFWTTNYDRLLEATLPKASVKAKDADLLRDGAPNEQSIIKMHGELPDKQLPRSQIEKNPIIIAREDYETYPARLPLMWAKLNATFLTQSILFLGMSFNDPNLHHLFSLARPRFAKGLRKHFTIFKKPTSPSDLKIHQYRMNDLEEVGIRVTEIDDYDDLSEILEQLIVKSSPPYVFVAGSYDDDPHIDKFCEALGVLLAGTGIGVISGANRAGRQVSYSLGRNLQSARRYDPDKILIFFQAGSSSPPPSLEERIGTVVFHGADRTDMRRLMVEKARATLVIGGGDGTREEVRISEHARVPVIPVAMSGGVGKETWTSMIGNLTNYRYGYEPIDLVVFKQLADAPITAANAAFGLLKAALMISSAPS